MSGAQSCKVISGVKISYKNKKKKKKKPPPPPIFDLGGIKKAELFTS